MEINKKTNDIKVRVEKDLYEILDIKAKELSMPKAKIIREGIKGIIKLLDGVDDIKLNVYEIGYEALSKEVNELIAKDGSRDEREKLISKITKCLDGLYGIMSTTRDEILESIGLKYEDLFKQEITTVNMPVSTKLFELQEKYYILLKKLYNYKSPIKFE